MRVPVAVKVGVFSLVVMGTYTYYANSIPQIQSKPPAELSLEIPEGAPPPPLRFVMEPVAARLSVTSTPSGARVLVDGVGVGITPLEPTSVTPGRRMVQVEKKGFISFAREVEARMGKPLEVSAPLAPAPATRESREGTPPTTLSASWVSEGDLVPVDASVTPPVKISGAAAVYPQLARRIRMLGAVGVEMVVDENGTPQDLRVIESAGPILDRAVVDAVATWRYEPARKNGVKVKVRWVARQSFTDGSGR